VLETHKHLAHGRNTDRAEGLCVAAYERTFHRNHQGLSRDFIVLYRRKNSKGGRHVKDLWEHLDKRLDRLDDRLDRLDEHVSDIKVVQGKQYISLEEHMRRTELAEKALQTFDTRLKPLENRELFWRHLAMVGGAVGAALGLVLGLLKYLWNT
jgi:hypothetical protein